MDRAQKRFSILVKTGSSKGPLVEKCSPAEGDEDNKGDNYIVYVREKPYKGLANKKVIEIFAKHLNVPKSKIAIIRGDKSHNKTISLDI
ncbi:MAG: DUF167 domain-containing protein [Bifidobacteriaceae bacterium]|jgi:uncharacterized protein YggU (UPF0235/DUF167 family)|nr:DUF167 domain-containing protein [Bifidobacteriaceae bacterium]